MHTLAPSLIRPRHTSMAGVSRVSPAAHGGRGWRGRGLRPGGCRARAPGGRAGSAGRGRPRTGVLLEGEAKDGDALVGDGVEHGADHALHKALLLQVVHGDHAVPVVGHLLEAHRLAHVAEVEDVLLEAGAWARGEERGLSGGAGEAGGGACGGHARGRRQQGRARPRTAKADGGVEELEADARVGADGVRHLLHVGARGLAQRRDGVDGGDALRQEGVGRQLGELRGPEVGGEDALGGHPVLVHGLERRDGLLARGRLGAADQHLRRRRRRSVRVR